MAIRLDSLGRCVRSCFLCALVGVCFPIPFLATYDVVTSRDAICVSEAFGPLVFIVSILLIGWGSSLVSGLVCRQIIVGYYSLISVFLANSSGWICLLFIYFYSEPGTVANENSRLLLMFFFSVIGFLITWLAMKPMKTRKNPSVGQTDNIPKD